MAKISGHYRAPTCIRFYDPVGSWLISSCGADKQVRITSTKTTISLQISQQGLVKKKKDKLQNQGLEEATAENVMLPVVTDFDFCTRCIENFYICRFPSPRRLGQYGNMPRRE